MGAKQSKAALPNQQGKTFVVTGANSGLGYIVAKELCAAGGHVVVCARSREKSLGACQTIQKELAKGSGSTAKATPSADDVVDAGANGGKLEVGVIDLASLASVKAFAASVSSDGTATGGVRPIHCLINNAGVFKIPTRELSPDGFEMQFATNCLGHYALSVLLVPALKQAGTLGLTRKPRVVNVSSIMARTYIPPADASVPVDFVRNPDPTTGAATYKDSSVYAETKLVNLMINNHMAQQCKDQITCVGCHPGVCSTNLFKHSFGWAKFTFQSAEAGAQSILQAAVMPEAGEDTTPNPLQEEGEGGEGRTSSSKVVEGGGGCCSSGGGVQQLQPVVSGQSYFGPPGWYGGPQNLLMPSAALDPAQTHRYWAALETATGIRLDESA